MGPNAIKDPEILAEDAKYAEKYRADHRHHAIDAFVIANCSPKVIQQWAAEEEQWEFYRRQNREKYQMDLLPPYGEETYHVVKKAVAKIIVSHRTDHRVSGELHLANPNSPKDKESPIEILANDRSAIKRHFGNSDNHHVEVYAVLDKKGNKKWEIEVVSLFTAFERKRHGKQVVNVDQKPNFLFALHKGDCVKIYKKVLDRIEDRNGEIFRVTGVNTNEKIKIWHHMDARPWDMKASSEYQEKYDVPVCPALNSLRSRLVKIEVDVLGNITSPTENQ